MRTKEIWWSSILLFVFILLGNAIGYWNIELFFPGWWTLFIILPYVNSLFLSGLTLFTTLGLSTGLLCLAADLKYHSYEVGSYLALLFIVVLLSLKGLERYRHQKE